MHSGLPEAAWLVLWAVNHCTNFKSNVKYSYQQSSSSFGVTIKWNHAYHLNKAVSQVISFKIQGLRNPPLIFVPKALNCQPAHMALSVNGQKILIYKVSAKITRKKNDDKSRGLGPDLKYKNPGQVLGMNSSFLSKKWKKREKSQWKTFGIGSFLYPFSNQKRAAVNTKVGHKKGTPLKIK